MIGTVLSIGGLLRARSELMPGEELDYGLTAHFVIGIVGGTASGVLWRATRRVRAKGKAWFYLGWGLTGFGGMGAVLLPDLILRPSVFLAVFWVVLGFGMGGGLALTEQELRR